MNDLKQNMKHHNVTYYAVTKMSEKIHKNPLTITTARRIYLGQNTTIKNYEKFQEALYACLRS
jgi:hypothetical protein